MAVSEAATTATHNHQLLAIPSKITKNFLGISICYYSTFRYLYVQIRPRGSCHIAPGPSSTAPSFKTPANTEIHQAAHPFPNYKINAAAPST
tara:strand:- start:68 stop:343 length:276 start_codon:yes stop_codon:yes gene_type:complete